jgi:hypothetical protein
MSVDCECRLCIGLEDSGNVNVIRYMKYLDMFCRRQMVTKFNQNPASLAYLLRHQVITFS